MAQKGMSPKAAQEIRLNRGLKDTKLQKIRVIRGLSQSQLAEKAGMPASSIRHYEQRTREIDNARLDTLLNLCIAMNCTMTDILENSNSIEKFEKVLRIPSIKENSSVKKVGCSNRTKKRQ